VNPQAPERPRWRPHQLPLCVSRPHAIAYLPLLRLWQISRPGTRGSGPDRLRHAPAKGRAEVALGRQCGRLGGRVGLDKRSSPSRPAASGQLLPSRCHLRIRLGKDLLWRVGYDRRSILSRHPTRARRPTFSMALDTRRPTASQALDASASLTGQRTLRAYERAEKIVP
jgi:hypothetical protein